jgi:DNA-directed RNA polymerase subunit beta'
MIAHGARDVLRDSLAVRGTMDDEYWRGLRAGRALPEPKTPFIYDKFLNTLRAGGVNVTQKGDLVSVMPQTDADVLAMAPAEINPRDPGSFIDSDFNPVKGGLFDPGKTGGMEGRKWTYYSLPEPLPNPIMEEPIRRVLGLTTRAMESVLTGETKLNGKTGGQALRSALSDIDIDARIAELKDQVKNTRGQSRDSAVKALGFLSAARKQGINPGDWMITKVPVLPPVFRPVARAGDMALSADINELYRDLMVSADNYKKLSQELEPEELKSDRLGVYKALTAVYGLGDPITPEGRAKNVKGAIRQIIGDSPKHGMFQSKVISKPVGIVGRGVITGDKSLDMDTVGIPEDSAWQLYRDFIIRGLVRRGYAGDRAISSVDNRTETAKQILEYEMSNRPVIIDRAPTWHKFNLLAFNPKIVDGSTIRVSPLIVKGFNADFDGDQMNFHVPVMDSAVRQAKAKMMPTQNLTALTDLRSVIHAPTNEFVAGLYVLTRPAKPGVPRKFDSLKALKLAYKRGEIQADDPVVIP